MHTLGLKPNMYSTPQLIVKLKSEGLGDGVIADNIKKLLETVGTTNAKSMWALRPEHLAEVDVNWNFYSETDKQLVKR